MDNLTPELIAAILAFQGGGAMTQGAYGQPGGYAYAPSYTQHAGAPTNQTGGGAESWGQAPNTTEQTGFTRTGKNGRNFTEDQYGMGGDYKSTRNWQDGTALNDLLKGGAFVGAGAFGLPYLAEMLGAGGLAAGAGRATWARRALGLAFSWAACCWRWVSRARHTLSFIKRHKASSASASNTSSIRITSPFLLFSRSLRNGFFYDLSGDV